MVLYWRGMEAGKSITVPLSLVAGVPGIYTGRTRHIHVKVQAPDGPVLTTQLYFPGEPDNDRDGIFQPELVLSDVRDRGDTRQGSFTFVLEG